MTQETSHDLGWTYQGYRVESNSASYSCPCLKLYGYRGPAEIEAAIRRAVKLATKRAETRRNRLYADER